MEYDALLDKNLQIVEEINRRAKLFSKSTIIISILDVLFGVLALYCTSLSTIAMLTSVMSLTVISVGRKVVQVSKIAQLEKSLKNTKLLSLAWFVNKLNKLNKGEQKMTKSTLLQKILTTVLAVFGVGGVVSMFLPQYTNIAVDVSNIVAMVSEIIAVTSGIWLSQTSDAVVSDAELEAKESAKKKAQAEKELAEAQALVEKYQKAKALVDANRR